MTKDKKIEFRIVVPFFLLFFLLTLLFFLIERKRLYAEPSFSNPDEYFEAVYKTALTKEQKDRIASGLNFIWETAPEELRGQYRLPGVSMGFVRDTVVSESNFRADNWIEVTHTCQSGCQYPICSKTPTAFWGYITPGSGLFLNTGEMPLVALNEIAAYHMLLSKDIEERVGLSLETASEAAWTEMAALVDDSESYAIMGRVEVKHDLFFKLLTLLAWAVGIVALMIIIPLSPSLPIVLFVVGLLILLSLLFMQLSRRKKGVNTVGSARAELDISTKEMLKICADPDSMARTEREKDICAGLASLKSLSAPLVILARSGGYSSILLRGSRTFCPSFCMLRNDVTGEGLCSDFVFRTGPLEPNAGLSSLSSLGPDLFPSTICECCESPEMRCSNCKEHISYDLCRPDNSGMFECLSILPNATPCN